MTKAEHELTATRQQRDMANNQIADLYGQLMAAQERIAELEKAAQPIANVEPVTSIGKVPKHRTMDSIG